MKPYRYLVERFRGAHLVHEEYLREEPNEDILRNLRCHFLVEVTPLFTAPQMAAQAAQTINAIATHLG